jgi:hypothetical protein
MSTYCFDNLTKPSNSVGMKKWFRIETQVYLLEPTSVNAAKGRSPKLMVFKVVPYYVHEGPFNTPTGKAPGYGELTNEVAREYNYIYTGKNTDIINFNIRFPTLAVKPSPKDKSNYAWSVYPQSTGVLENKPAIPITMYNEARTQDALMGVHQLGSVVDIFKNSHGGLNDTFRTLVAKVFHHHIIDSAGDMAQVEMEILGDPYYISDSGLGNYVDDVKSFNVTKHGAMEYRNGEVDVLINYRTPVDYDPNSGIMDFQEDVTTIPGFSGLYRVNLVSNIFNRGRFTQKLQLSRRPNQDPTTTEETKGNVPEDVGNPLSASQTQAANQKLISKEKGISSPIVGLVDKPLGDGIPELTSLADSIINKKGAPWQ